MSSGGSQTTTQMSEPWSGAQPHLNSVMNQAAGLYNSGLGQQYYQGDTVVPWSPQTQTAMDMTQELALQGNPLLDQAFGTTNQVMQGATPQAGYYQSVMQGDYLNSNPYLDQTFNRMADTVASNVNARMGLAGRTGSGAATDVMTDSLGQLANQVYGQNYQMERDRQSQAAQGLSGVTDQALRGALLSPQLGASRYADAQALQGVGGAYEDMAGQYVQDQLNRWNFSQQAPWDVLQQYGNFAMGIGGMGGTQQSTAPRQRGGLAGAVGGGLSGLGAAGAFGATGPVGWGLGALGALGGFF